jgi:[protein-PII] uridylyltransferase
VRWGPTRSDTTVEQRAATGDEGLRAVRASLLSQRLLQGRRFCERYSAAVDSWLAGLLDEAIRGAGDQVDGEGIALVAVGGYGRSELCPGSDLDLLLVHDRGRDVGPVADALWYPIWDAGIHVDHSVRTVHETVDLAKADLKTALGMLSARAIAGDERLAARAAARCRRQWASRPRTTLRRLREAQLERWSAHGELAFLLEPDLKLSRGGLRDVESLLAIVLAAPVAAPLLEDPLLEAAIDTLLDVRVGLHATTGRRNDQLLLEEQDAVARRLGLADADELLPAVAAAARRVAWTTDRVWRRVDAWIAGLRRPRRERAVEPGIALVGDELTLDGRIDPGSDSDLALRIAEVSARSGIPIGAEALSTLQRDAIPPPEPWPSSTRDALLGLLGCGPAAVPMFETLDHIGVLGRYLREWPAVRSKPQRNAYHRYTVDRHLFETAARAARLTRTVTRPDLLLIGAWLHDLGKGYPGDHTEAGERLVAGIAARMGFADEDAATLSRMVRNHLLLAKTATRRDLSDPATTATVAERVGTSNELDLLAALTEADSIATGPAAWNTWKAKLLEELVVRTRGYLAGDRPRETTPSATEGQRGLMAEGRLRVVAEVSRVTVVAPDRPGLLATVTGVLAAGNLQVRAATGVREGAMAVEVFDLDTIHSSRVDAGSLEAAVEAALADPAGVEARVSRRRAVGRLPRRPSAARVAAPRVLTDNEATPRATIVEVRAPDGPGLLFRIARALAACRCDIVVVRAQTMGHEVVDTFYVTDAGSGTKIDGADRLRTIRESILAELREAPVDGPSPGGSSGRP